MQADDWRRAPKGNEIWSGDRSDKRCATEPERDATKT